VEDLPEQAEIVAHELRNAGFTLAWSIASDLATCRSAIEAGVDVVVADCDAVEFELPALMALVHEHRHPPPVVSLSTDDEVARECLRAGASAFLYKFRLDQIGDLVRSLVETGSPRGAAAGVGGLAGIRSFAESACDLIVELAADGRLLYANPSVERELGYAADELAGRRVFELVHPDDLSGALEFLRNAVEEGSASRGLHRARRRDGCWRWLESAGSPYRTADGERRIVAIARDVTESLAGLQPVDPPDASVEPAEPSTDGVAADPPTGAPKDTGPRTILLVMDDPSLRSAIRETLEEEEYAVVEAASGEEALERAAESGGPIHLLLSDAVLPGIGGLELARRMAASQPRIRPVLISDTPVDGVGSPPDASRPPGFLAKPFTLSALRSRLREILEED
jgi:PAS domain S-box-containing protein